MWTLKPICLAEKLELAFEKIFATQKHFFPKPTQNISIFVNSNISFLNQ